MAWIEWLEGKKSYLVIAGGIAYVWLQIYFNDYVITAEEVRHAVELTIAALYGTTLRAGVGTPVQEKVKK